MHERLTQCLSEVELSDNKTHTQFIKRLIIIENNEILTSSSEYFQD